MHLFQQLFRWVDWTLWLLFWVTGLNSLLLSQSDWNVRHWVDGEKKEDKAREGTEKYEKKTNLRDWKQSSILDNESSRGVDTVVSALAYQLESPSLNSGTPE